MCWTDLRVIKAPSQETLGIKDGVLVTALDLHHMEASMGSAYTSGTQALPGLQGRSQEHKWLQSTPLTSVFARAPTIWRALVKATTDGIVLSPPLILMTCCLPSGRRYAMQLQWQSPRTCPVSCIRSKCGMRNLRLCTRALITTAQHVCGQIYVDEFEGMMFRSSPVRRAKIDAQRRCLLAAAVAAHHLAATSGHLYYLWLPARLAAIVLLAAHCFIWHAVKLRKPLANPMLKGSCAALVILRCADESFSTAVSSQLQRSTDQRCGCVHARNRLG